MLQEKTEIMPTKHGRKAESLTSAEKEVIDEALTRKGFFESQPAYLVDKEYLRSGLTEDEAREAIEAQQKIVSYGSRALSYLMEQTIEERPYFFSVMADNMTCEGGFETLLDALSHPRVVDNPDGSSASVLNAALQRFIIRIRDEDPDDARLQEISERLLPVVKRSDVGNKRSEYMRSFFLTGAPSSREFAERHPGDHTVESLRNLLYDPENLIIRSRCSLHTLETLRDTLRSRQEQNSPPFDVTDDSFYQRGHTIGYSGSVLEEPEDDPPEDNTGDDYGNQTNKEVARFDDTEMERMAERAIEVVDSFGLEGVMIPVARLAVFNQLSRDDSESSIERLHRKLTTLSRIEHNSEKLRFLPTIGVEIECHDELAGKQKKALLKKLEVPSYRDRDYDTGEVFQEVNPEYSHGAAVQSKYLQEVVNLELIALESDEEARAHIPADHILSLHINLGLVFPARDDDYSDSAENKRRREAYALSDVMNFAYTSPTRLRGRKTNTSVDTEGSVYPSEKLTTLSEDKKNSFRIRRLELRASEFRSYKSFRMLSQVQKIGAALQAHLLSEHDEILSPIQQKLSTLWGRFKTEYKSIQRKYSIASDNLMDDDKNAAALLIEENPSLSEDCRELMFRYAAEADGILQSAVSGADRKPRKKKLAKVV